MPNYDDDARQVEILLFEHLSAREFKEFEENLESGVWSLTPYSNRVWGVGTSRFDTYEVDLIAGTVSG